MIRVKYSVALMAMAVFLCSAAVAQNAAELDKKVDEGMVKLRASSEAAKLLEKEAKGILLFPRVKKAGFIVGGQKGEGALRIGGVTKGYYKTTAASFGLQIGGQTFGYAMFFMNDGAMKYLKDKKGWEVGVGPTIVVADEGTAAALTNASGRKDIYVFFFGQKGLMAGLNIEGSKITKINK